MYNEVITLASESTSVDDYGDRIKVRTTKEVFANVMSIGQSEFYASQASGLKPEIKFVIADYLDYSNEKIVLYKAFNESEAREYRVIRTYRSGNELEITCSRGVDE